MTTISTWKDLYVPILEHFQDGEEHKASEINKKIKDTLSEEVKAKVKSSWFTYPYLHFRQAGCLERTNLEEKTNFTQCITEDGRKLLDLNLEYIDASVLKEHCPKFKEAYDKGTVPTDDDVSFLNGDIKHFEKGIHESQAFFTIEDIKLKRSGGGQGSYYVDEFYKYAKKNNIIIQIERTELEGYPNERGRDKDDVYKLNEDYEFILGSNLLDLIGDAFNNNKNKFLVSYPQTIKDGEITGKPQLNKKVYGSLSDNNHEGYDWFVELYNKNITDNRLLFDIDEANSKLIVDVKFSALTKFLSDTGVSSSNSEEEEIEEEYGIEDIDYPHNRVVFGAPGTGKSFRLEKNKKVFGDRFERVTFHPNYSYSQFVGTYKPVPKSIGENGKKKEIITYEYVPGPFMRTFVKASGSEKPYLLLIEEINRSNVSAVFGDMFQLLDRKDGQSEYDIETSEDMRIYLKCEIEKDNLPEDFDTDRIRIPKNMYIWATMNSADQGVFPMDTAFKRRWDFEYIGINEEETDIKEIEFNVCNNSENESHRVNWNDLRRGINYVLSNDCNINEDKLLGPYFLSGDVIKTNKQMNGERDGTDEENLVYDNEKFIKAFKSKVLMYLFEDAAKQKQHRQKLFRGCDSPTITKYSSICDAFDKKGEAIFGEDILSKGKE